MTQPTYTTRIAFASDALASSPTWVDVSDYVRAIDIRRGRQHELDRIEAGTASISLLNADGRFWPSNAGGAYYPNVLPGKRINIRATWSGVTYDIFTGYIESWDFGFIGTGGSGPGVGVVELTASDGMRILNNAKLSGSYAQQRSGTRVGAILDAISWPAADRTITAGRLVIQASGSLSGTNALDHLQTVGTTEGGILFVDGAGKIVYQDGNTRLTSPYTVSQATFGDGVGELRYQGIEFQYDDMHLYNEVRLTRDGGSEQLVSDATSQAAYAIRTLDRSGLLQVDDEHVQSQAVYLLSQYKDPALRVASITVRPQQNPSSLWPQVLGRDISDRITLKLGTASINADHHIEGVSHTFRAGGIWETEWSLSAASTAAYWILDTSQLGTDTKLFY